MRTFLRAVVLLLPGIWVLAGSPASAQDLPFYLRSGALLSPVPPDAGATTASSAMTIPSGESALLGTFASAPLESALSPGQVRAVVFLGTGRPGMEGCGVVTATLYRVTGVAQIAVAGGTVTTTIRPRRQLTEPIIIPMPIGEVPLVGVGDRLMFELRVGNVCGGERRVLLLYDSVGRSSRVELLEMGPPTTTTTTTTTSTTTTIPPTCLEAAVGLPAVRCRLEVMDGILRSTSPSDLGGARFTRRLVRRVERALTRVRAAELIGPTRRRLRKVRRQIVRFTRLLEKGQGSGRVAPEVGGLLHGLAEGAASALEGVGT